jgi:hypothetical protein
MSMDTMDTMGHYRLYVALRQSPIDSPGFADAVRIELKTLGILLTKNGCCGVSSYTTGSSEIQ